MRRCSLARRVLIVLYRSSMTPRVLLLLTSLAVFGGSGCGLLIGVDPDDAGSLEEDLEPSGPDRDCITNVDGDCVLASDACSPDDLQTHPDGSACAQCVEGEETIEICGDRTTVQCSQLENAFGDPCQRCVTASLVLYDDCILAAVPDGEVFCEQVEVGGVEAGASDDTGSIVVEDDQDCEVCYDAEGSVVSTSCRPEADTCETVVIDGRACEQCTYEGQLAYLVCEDVDLDPDVCEVYENDEGRCVDCYQNNALISHTCTLGDPGAREPGFCESFDTFDGLICTECFDDAGNPVDFFCEEPSTAAFCQELVFEQAQQVCTVCVDIDGEVTESECLDLACLEEVNDPGACINTTPCTFVESADGQLCRECPITDGSGLDNNTVERECLDAGGSDELVCEEAFDFFDAPGDPDDPNADPIVEEVRCIRCYGPDGDLEYEECEGMGGEPAPPTCAYEILPDGTECLVCSDPSTGDVVYDCGGIAPECYEDVIEDELCWVCDGQVVECYPPPLTCTYDDGELLGDNGDPVTFVADNGDVIEAVVDCSECFAEDNADVIDFASCSLRDACRTDEGDPGGGGMTPGGDPVLPPDALCAESNLWFYEIPQCELPWQEDGVNVASGSADELQQIMRWLLGMGIVPQSVTTYLVDIGDVCAACSCASGRVLELWTAATDNAEGTLFELGFEPG
jgi:hypothetical protein